jgi:uncharacterized protein
MSAALKIADGVTLPIEAVTQTIAILAKRRAGKSYTARRLAEQLHKAKQQIVIVDPKGDHWGIRSAADGKSPGLPIVILGGEHGDVPLEVGSGEIVAKLVVEERVSALLDLSLLRKHEIATFMTAFLETLYRLKAREQYRTPLMLIVDEADAIMPQKPQPNEARMLGAGEDIVRRGGQRGIGCALITQRSAVLNKNVLTQAEMIIALRTIAPQDLKALDAWVEVHGDREKRDALMAALPSLPIGEACFWSPGWPTSSGIFKTARVLEIETFDSGKTPTAGEKRREPKQLADVDIGALTRQMADTIERAKADDPKTLREITKLKAQLHTTARTLEAATAIVEKGHGRAAIKAQIDRAHHRGVMTERKVWRTRERELSKAIKVLAALAGDVVAIGDSLRTIADGMTASLAGGDYEIVDEPVLVHDGKPLAITPLSRVRTAMPSDGYRVTKDMHDDDVYGRHVDIPPLPRKTRGRRDVEQQILDTLAELQALGVEQPPRAQLAVLMQVHPRNKAFLQQLADSQRTGVISFPTAGTVYLTAAGAKRAKPQAPITTREALQRRWLDSLDGIKRRIVDVLLSNMQTLTREQLAELLGVHPRNKAYLVALAQLHELGATDHPRAGSVVLTSIVTGER